MKEYALQERTIVVFYKDTGNEEPVYPYKTIKNWSNLLEFALEGNMSDLQDVMKGASGEQINEALSVLPKALSLAEEYTPGIEEEYGFWNGELLNVWESSIKPEKLHRARVNLISSLEPRHFSEDSLSNLTKQDKRLIEKNLLAQIETFTTQEAIDMFLKTYEPVLEHQRNPLLETLRSTFFSPHASTLKLHVMEKIREKETELSMSQVMVTQ